MADDAEQGDIKFDMRKSIDISVSSASSTADGDDDNNNNKPALPPSQREKGAKAWLKRRKEKIFRKKTLYMRFPILKWLPLYTVQDLIADFVAGVTVGVTVIPQGLAYGTVAGLPPQYGLYAAYVGCFVYTFLGSTKAITIGPTALMALITYETSVVLGPQGAVLLTFFTGIIILALGLLNLGFLVDFISEPVVGGFTSAAAFNIATTQLENLLGLSFDAEGFVATWKAVFEHIKETRTWDAVMGFGSIAALLLLRIFDQIKIGEPGKLTLWQRVFNETFRMISTARNAIIIVIGTIIAASLTTEDNKPFKLTGNIPAGLPPFAAPNFTIEYANQTYEFPEVMNLIGSSVFVSPLIAILESVAIARSVAKGQRVDATQEMIAIGTSNLIGSFVSSFPVTGSFSRTAVNSASGVRTALGGIYTGALVLLAITVLTPYFYYIPKSCLAAVIICAVIFMVEVRLVKHVWRSRKLDIIPLFATFVCCLFIGLEQGIIIGSLVSLAMLLYSTARPRMLVDKQTMNGIDYLMVTPDRSIVFPAMDYFTSALRKASAAHPNVPVVIDMHHVSLADFSTAYSFDHVTRTIHSRTGYPVIITRVQPRVLQVLKGVKPDFEVHSDASSLDQTIRCFMEIKGVATESQETIVPAEA